MRYTLSQRLAHFFHVVSNIRPVVWIGIYVCITPIFALIYWGLPDGQFRIPDGGGTDYGSWLYYSIVTITTLGFGDYTPAHPGAQAVTAVEVMCGLIFLGFFLNAVGAMKSEIDVESEIEKQRALHHAAESDKLQKSLPMVLNSLNVFLAYCYAVTTPVEKREKAISAEGPAAAASEPDDLRYNPDFTFRDLSGMFQPSGLPFDRTNLPAVERLMHSAAQTSLALDSLQQRIDLTLWPQLLEDCFSFVANFQMFSNTDLMFRNPDHIILSDGTSNPSSVKEKLADKIANWNPDDDLSQDPDLKAVVELFQFIKENAERARQIATELTEIAMTPAS
ncbi:MAG: two pore domain potassium channel family protein [Muribaculaceae bacterium]|nr:two pore domain potassium channel family protein [Muribaculaceae bacterium]